MKSRSKGFIVNVPEEWKLRIIEHKCPVCNKPSEEWNRRKDYRCCSVKCTEEFNLKVFKYWTYFRRDCFIRDNYCCVKCKVQHKDFELIADHIIPIALNGEEYDLTNLQTLCLECNKIKTKSDLKNIATFRKLERTLNKNQSLKT